MEPEGAPQNDLDVRLRWPDSDRAEALPASKKRPSDDERPVDDPPPPAAAPVTEAALAPLAARVDDLATALDSLRSLLTSTGRDLRAALDRIDALADRVDHSTEGAARREATTRQLLEDLGARFGAFEVAAGDSRTDPSANEAAVTGALERVEQAVSTLTSNLVEQASVAERLVELEETVSRLEAVRTQDLEQLLEAIDETGRREIAVPDDVRRALTAKGGADTRQARETRQALKRLEERLAVMEELLQESQAGGEGEQDLGLQLEQINEELERLRRRITLRGRSEPPLDDEALEYLAVQIAERLATPTRADQPPGRRRRG